RSPTARIIVSEPLPTFRRGAEKFSRLLALNECPTRIYGDIGDPDPFCLWMSPNILLGLHTSHFHIICVTFTFSVFQMRMGFPSESGSSQGFFLKNILGSFFFPPSPLSGLLSWDEFHLFYTCLFLFICF
ncbi:hypothetical protein AMELA_G00078470, partial [Ameiurus melas]